MRTATPSHCASSVKQIEDFDVALEVVPVQSSVFICSLVTDSLANFD